MHPVTSENQFHCTRLYFHCPMLQTNMNTSIWNSITVKIYAEMAIDGKLPAARFSSSVWLRQLTETRSSFCARAVNWKIVMLLLYTWKRGRMSTFFRNGKFKMEMSKIKWDFTTLATRNPFPSLQIKVCSPQQTHFLKKFDSKLWFLWC